MKESKQPHNIPSYHKALVRDRWQIVIKLDRALEIPMMALGFLWTALVILDLAGSLRSSFRILLIIFWGAFILEFFIKLLLSPSARKYFNRTPLIRASALLPSLRMLRVIHIIRQAKASNITLEYRVARILSALNRSMSEISTSMKRRSFGYVFTFTIAVIFIGGFALYIFERRVNEDLQTYGASLWTTAMILTSIGSDFFPVTPEGRVLCFILALYGYAVFGYFTAIFASYFYDKDTEGMHGDGMQIQKLRSEISELREEIKLLIKQSGDNITNKSDQDTDMPA